MSEQAPLGRAKMTREEAEEILTQIERAAIVAATDEALYQGVGPDFIVEALDRAGLWAWSNLCHRLHARKRSAA